MCGIAGGWWRDYQSALRSLPVALREMHHRGPDDSGHNLFKCGSATFGLAQSRLSIIDLSAAGHQPMYSRDHRWVIVFNGEIYNYKELREELRQLGRNFFSDSDTEVLLTAWVEWGDHCLKKLVGMFAFAVVDRQERILTCVRDPFGVKPFFYTNNNEGFRFASELPALLSLLTVKPSLNQQRAYDYLVHGSYDSSDETFYHGIYHLLPGHLLTVNLVTGRANSPKEWWFPSFIDRPGWRFDDAVEEVRERFLNNVRLHLRSDRNCGAALSGGVDSSAVVCAMRYVEPDLPIHTFSYIAGGSTVNEERWVNLINSHVSGIPHKISLSSDDLSRDLDDVIRTQGEPFGSTSVYASYRVYKLAADAGVTVVLDGQGADEMLAGYIGYPGPRLRSLLETNQLLSAWEFFNNWSDWPGRSKTLAAKYLLSEMAEGPLYRWLRRLNGKPSAPAWINAEKLRERGVLLEEPKLKQPFAHKGRRVMEKLAISLCRGGLTHLLRHADRNSMRFSVESRVPFLTTDMVNLLLSMPEEYLISNHGETKSVFRRAMQGIVPETILSRKEKIGFETADTAWLGSFIHTHYEKSDWEEFENLNYIFHGSRLKEGLNYLPEKTKWRIFNFTKWVQINEDSIINR
jgi:asparagine synthase (glutamine-hydrolysing)